MRADFHFPMPVRVSALCLMFMYGRDGTRGRAQERAFNLHSFDFVCYKSFVIFNLMKRCYYRSRCRRCCCCDMAMLIWVFSFDAYASCDGILFVEMCKQLVICFTWFVAIFARSHTSKRAKAKMTNDSKCFRVHLSQTTHRRQPMNICFINEYHRSYHFKQRMRKHIKLKKHLERFFFIFVCAVEKLAK